MRALADELPKTPALELVVFAMRDAKVEDAFRRALQEIRRG